MSRRNNATADAMADDPAPARPQGGAAGVESAGMRVEVVPIDSVTLDPANVRQHNRHLSRS